MMLTKDKLYQYYLLMRADKPIGTYLLLWPAYWALWIAAEGVPSLLLFVVFTAGVFLTRSGGCVINDFADRKVDGSVKRTAQRPLATGKVSSKEAIGLFVVLMLVAFAFVLLTNPYTIALSFAALALAFCYPFMKRYTHFPQVVLGAAFSWSIPMAFAATLNEVPTIAWMLYGIACIWTVAYDTYYAMVDRDDDLKIGIKSTAVLFGHYDLAIIAALMAVFLAGMAAIGVHLGLSWVYFVGLFAALLLIVRQLWTCRHRERGPCFAAFLNNHYVGLVIFIGLAAHYFFYH